MAVSNDSPTKEMTMNEKSPTGTDSPEKQRKLGATLAAILLTIFGLFSSVGGYLKGNIVSWQDYVLLGTPIVVFILGLTSLVLLRRGKFHQGSSLVFIANLILPIVATLLQTGVGWAVSIYALTSSVVLIWRVMPKDTRNWTTSLAALAFVLVLVIEWINPSIRVSASNELSTFFYIASATLVAIFVVQFVLRLWTKGSIQTKIVLWAGIGFFLSAATMIGYAAFTLRDQISRSAEETAQRIAREKAAEINTILERTLGAAETFTQSVVVVKTEGVQLSRDQVNAMLRQWLKDNPQFVGVDVLWEPNAFDGMDAEFVNTEGSDSNGRFLPYWTRGEGGKIQVELLQDYDTSDWYQCPKKTKVPCLINPLIYPVQGKDVLMTSIVVPFVVNGTFYGITGVDTPATFLQEIADNANIYDGKGILVILSNDGKLLGVTGRPDLIGQPATALHEHFSTQDYLLVQNGKEDFRYSPDGMLEAYAPIQVGNTATPWSVNVIVPSDIILADATNKMGRMFGIGSGLLIISLIALFYAARQIALPIRKITEVAQMVTSGNLSVTADVKNADEIGILANAFNQMTAQLREFIGTLESRVAERTRNLELAAEVGRTVSQVRALDVMLTDAAELIRQQFNLYYVQVYLTDNSQTNLILQSGTGDVGRQLISRGHSLPLNTSSINGRAAVEKKSVVISDTTTSATFKPNPLLPSTRSEMAVPLIAGNKVVGVLDMQSEKAGSLSQDILPAFEALAGQLTIAIQNASLLTQAQQARDEVEAQARRLTHASWAEYLDAVHKPEEIGFVFEQNKITPLVTEKQEKESALTAPIAIAGEALGNLVVEMEGGSPIARTEELINTVARQVAQQIENLRLLESAERFRYEAEQASRRLTQEGWQEYMDANISKGLGYLYDLKEVRPYSQDAVNQQTQEPALSQPIKVRDETIGKLVVAGVEGEEAGSIVNAVAERLGAHIEGLRLSMQTEQALASTKKQAQREQALRQITSAVRGSTDPAIILKTAARELGNLLGRKTVVHLATAAEENETVPPVEPSTADGGK